jgi:hypothetical protein
MINSCVLDPKERVCPLYLSLRIPRIHFRFQIVDCGMLIADLGLRNRRNQFKDKKRGRDAAIGIFDFIFCRLFCNYIWR